MSGICVYLGKCVGEGGKYKYLLVVVLKVWGGNVKILILEG